MARRRQPPTVIIPLEAIEAATSRGVRVVIRGRRRGCWVPRGQVEFLPGAMKVPEWLAEVLAPPGGAPCAPRADVGKSTQEPKPAPDSETAF